MGQALGRSSRPLATAAAMSAAARHHSGKMKPPNIRVMKPGEKPRIVRADEVWKKTLDKASFHVLRQEGTEMPGSHEYIYNEEKGIYRCKGCGKALFPSETKYVDGSGWPAFTDALPDAVLAKDVGGGVYEVVCADCHGHLGHIFQAPENPTGIRH